ncbi:mannose-6-phosphate isomerase [Nitzschia inconspicua]|uniref:Mannose-6-phosphate isomerase n=1 Tax=Nitzschia inconspicua TaxID=303405 RepID=A0A9K3Q2U9_9STRA|nr:mannose-6-phosphate isomerase [Nitzschia inconspicua]
MGLENGQNGHADNGNQDDGSDSAAVNTRKSVIGLIPVAKDYAWGIRGMDSRVARYALESKAIDEVDPDCPYAELWIGTHPKGPSKLKTGEYLRDAIGEDLPFLFKVLSAGKALSIQAHPDKENAKRLNIEDPVNYGDANHKPEMAIALTPFEAMCGFRRLEEISYLIKKHPEFAACISEEAKLAVFLAQEPLAQRDALQKLFSSFMTCDPEVSSQQLNLLLIRLQAEQSQLHPHPHDEPAWERKCARAVLRLAQQFHGDPGAMAPLFLNYLLIAPGESFFMAANEPHAYVAGEIIECMACSDNVVRAGLTPKFKDVDNLVNMLTYSMGGPSIDAGAYMAESTDVIRYTPPCPEFEVMVLTIEPGHKLTYKNPKIPAVLIILEGSGHLDGKLCRPGRSYYWPPDADDLEFFVEQCRRGPMKVAMAHKNRHLDRPTAVNRDDFGGTSSHRISVPASPMPFLGMGGGRSPSSNHQKRFARDFEENDNAAIPEL